MIETAIYQRLAAFAGLTALVGGASAPRITPHLLTQDTAYPAVTYFVVSAPRETAMGSDPGIVHARMQVECWALKYLDAVNVAEQVRLALQRYRGTVAGTVILDTFIDDMRDFEPELVNGVIVRRREIELMVHYRE